MDQFTYEVADYNLTNAVVELMRNIINQYRKQPAFRALALRIIRNISTQPKRNYLLETKEIEKFVRKNVKYVKDVAGRETLQTPDVTLRIRRGDCDDQAILMATLLMSIGHKVALVLYRPKGAPTYNHVYIADYSSKIEIDTITFRNPAYFTGEKKVIPIVKNNTEGDLAYLDGLDGWRERQARRRARRARRRTRRTTRRAVRKARVVKRIGIQRYTKRRKVWKKIAGALIPPLGIAMAIKSRAVKRAKEIQKSRRADAILKAQSKKVIQASRAMPTQALMPSNIRVTGRIVQGGTVRMIGRTIHGGRVIMTGRVNMGGKVKHVGRVTHTLKWATPQVQQEPQVVESLFRE